MELPFCGGRFVSLEGDLNYREVLDDFPSARTIKTNDMPLPYMY